MEENNLVDSKKDHLKESLKSANGDLSKLSQEDQKQALAQLLGVDAEKINPKSYRRSSIATYYTERYAEELKGYLKRFATLEGTDQDMRLLSKKFNMSPRSLRVRVTQSWLYLIEKSETQEERAHYQALRDKVELSTEPIGIRFKWKQYNKDKLFIEPEILQKAEDKYQLQLKNELEGFIACAQDGDLLELKNLRLKEDHIVKIHLMIKPLNNFHVLTLNRRTIRIARYDATKKVTEKDL